MRAVSRARPSALRIDLTLPVTRVGFGPFSFDPVEQMIGAPVAAILESLMVGPVHRRPSAAGPAVDVYPLALPDGEGALVPLGAMGEVGFHNDAGLLVLTIPLSAGGWIERQLGDSVLQTEDDVSSDGASAILRLWIRLRPGARAAFGIGTLGEVAVLVPT